MSETTVNAGAAAHRNETSPRTNPSDNAQGSEPELKLRKAKIRYIMLPQPESALLKTGYAKDDIRRLPFIYDYTRAERKVQGRGRCFWHPGPLDLDYTERCNRGTEHAAAYLRFLRENPERNTWLPRIVLDMPAENDGYMVGFLDFVMSYACNTAGLLRPAEIEEDGKRVAAHSREFDRQRRSRRA